MLKTTREVPIKVVGYRGCRGLAFALELSDVEVGPWADLYLDNNSIRLFTLVDIPFNKGPYLKKPRERVVASLHRATVKDGRVLFGGEAGAFWEKDLRDPRMVVPPRWASIAEILHASMNDYAYAFMPSWKALGRERDTTPPPRYDRRLVPVPMLPIKMEAGDLVSCELPPASSRFLDWVEFGGPIYSPIEGIIDDVVAKDDGVAAVIHNLNYGEFVVRLSYCAVLGHGVVKGREVKAGKLLATETSKGARIRPRNWHVSEAGGHISRQDRAANLEDWLGGDLEFLHRQWLVREARSLADGTALFPAAALPYDWYRDGGSIVWRVPLASVMHDVYHEAVEAIILPPLPVKSLWTDFQATITPEITVDFTPDLVREHL